MREPPNMERDLCVAAVVVLCCLVGAATILGWVWTVALRRVA